MSQSIKERIRKLLELAASDNANEAALAMSMAQELMNRHNLDIITMSQEKAVDLEPIIEDPQPFFEGGRIREWKVRLASLLAQYNNCAILQFKTGTRSEPKNTLRIFGRQQGIDNARFLFAYALNLLTKLSVLPCIGSGHSYKDEWYLGAVAGISSKLYEMKQKVESEYSQFAVVKYNNWLQEVNDFIKNKYKTTTSKTKSRNTSTAYKEGFRTGKDLDLSSNSSSKLSTKSTIGSR